MFSKAELSRTIVREECAGPTAEKEGVKTDRKWEQGENLSLLEGKVTEYRPNETEKLVADPELQHEIRAVSIRALAKAAGVTENTVKGARRGERLQKRTVQQLRAALKA